MLSEKTSISTAKFGDSDGEDCEDEPDNILNSCEYTPPLGKVGK